MRDFLHADDRSAWLDPVRPVAALLVFVLVLVAGAIVLYGAFRIEVPSRHMAVLVRKTGEDLTNDQEIAPSRDHKGLQNQVLAEGRHFRNPWHYRWQVVPQVEIPQDKLGVRIRLSGDELPYGQVIAWQEEQKGIVPQVLRPGRYALNAWIRDGQPRRRDNYAEHVELHDPVVIPAGFKGVVTNLSGPMPQDPNVLLVENGQRGVQSETLSPGTYYVNPYVTRVNLVDCRSQRFNLATGGEMGFPSKDGFWVTLDGIIEFRVMPDQAANVFVVYNDASNDDGPDTSVDEEIINKVILPNARSFCRLRGSDHSGKDFISGDTRTRFQQDFQQELERTCESQGIEIIQALITRINPPQKIAEPVRQRQIAAQKQQQFTKEIRQQESEKELAIEQEKIKRKQALVEAQREVVKVTTEAQRRQEVAVIEANQRLKVAGLQLQAAQDEAAAILARGQAEAQVIELANQAEAAGWERAVQAFQGNGDAYARWVLLRKLAPAYRQIMVNTADSPIMNIFQQYQQEAGAPPSGDVPPRQPIAAAQPGAEPTGSPAPASVRGASQDEPLTQGVGASGPAPDSK
jgi:regulator of protease activity HflC (stomatin/prohibitin superfamily)